MTLQASESISFSDIRVELGGSPGVLTGLWAAESGGYGAINQCSDPKPTGAQPSSTTEWYSYNHLATSSTYVLGLDPTGGTGSSAGACNALETGDVNTYFVGVTYYKSPTCLNLVDAGYYAKISANTWYYFTPAGTLNSTGSCGFTTTTTTTLAPGKCYKVVNNSSVNTPILDWTDLTGTPRSGTTAVSATYFICSSVIPTERGGAADLTITECTTPSSCTNNCTSLACKPCGDVGTCI